MTHFDSFFFRSYIGVDQEIKDVFHRHPFVILEDIIVWTFFGTVIPAFLYIQNVFGVADMIDALWAYGYLFIIYAILMYKLFDWYVDVWIMTESTVVDMSWGGFSATLLYMPYENIEGMQVITRSWWTAMLGMSDVVVKLSGGDEFRMYSAAKPKEIVEFIQGQRKHIEHPEEDEDKEPFDILVDTLSDVVKGHLVTRGKEYITRDYVEKLDSTLVHGKPIDLRTDEEKIVIEGWKGKYQKKEEIHGHTEKSDHSH